MTTAVRPSFAFDNTYVRDLDGLYERWSAAQKVGLVTALVATCLVSLGS